MIGDNTLPELAAGIRTAHSRAKASAIEAAEQAIKAGQLLTDARVLVPHGEWAAWLQRHVGFSDRSARRYMQLARAGLTSATVAEMGIRAAVEALADGRGPIPKIPSNCELEIFEESAGDYVRPFCIIAAGNTVDGFYDVVGLDHLHQAVRSRPVEPERLELVLCVAFPTLTKDRWQWRLVDKGTFEQTVADLDEVTGDAPWQSYVPEIVERGRLIRRPETACPGAGALVVGRGL